MGNRLEWTTAGNNHVALYGAGEPADDGQAAEGEGNTALVIDGLAIEGKPAEIVALLTRAINVVVSAPEKTTVVVVTRDPDASNEYATFGPAVITHDIDAGNSDLSDADQYEEWAKSHYEDADRLEEQGHADAAAHIRSVVDQYA